MSMKYDGSTSYKCGFFLTFIYLHWLIWFWEIGENMKRKQTNSEGKGFFLSDFTSE